MEPTIQYFNSIEAAKILNVNVSTIKRWTQENKLECVKTPGGHRKFTMQQLSNFLNKNKTKTTKANLFPVEDEEDLKTSSAILKRDFKILQDKIFQEAYHCNRDKVQRILNGLYMSQTPLCDIYDQVVTPVLQRAGTLWEMGELSIAEEHFVTQTIRDCIIRLQGIIQVPLEKIGKAFCLIMSSELHDIALKMVDHILELNGYQVFFSGQMTPSIKIEKIFELYKPEKVFMSSSIVNDLNLAQAEFDKICYISATKGAKVFVGGRGFDEIEILHHEVVKRLFSLNELNSLLLQHKKK